MRGGIVSRGQKNVNRVQGISLARLRQHQATGRTAYTSIMRVHEACRWEGVQDSFSYIVAVYRSYHVCSVFVPRYRSLRNLAKVLG